MENLLKGNMHQQAQESADVVEQTVEPVGVIETDSFCDSCGYNLHSQPVVRDARLGILISRCPECGKFTAAGKATGAAHRWLQRLNVLLALVWAKILIVSMLTVMFFIGFGCYFQLEVGCTRASISELPPAWQAKAVQAAPPYVLQNQQDWTYFYVPRHMKENPYFRNRLPVIVMLISIAVASSFALGCIVSVGLWHWRHGMRYLAVLLVALPLGISWLTWHLDDQTILVRDWGAWRLLAWGGISAVLMALGIAIGRPIARGAIRLLLPPKLRQHLIFLWHVDGKVLPAT